MRKWIIAGIVLSSFCVVVVLALLNLNSLLNRNRDYLLGRAQQALGRKVSVGNVTVTLWGGVGVRLKNFILADDPSFSYGDFIRAEDLQVNVKLLPLLRKELRVKRLILNRPVIEIIRNNEGEFNFSTIAKQSKEQKKTQEKDQRAPDEEKARPGLWVSLLDISGGEVHYLDRKSGTDLRGRQVDMDVKDLDFDRPFSVELAAALFSEKQNVKVQTRIGPLRSGTDLSQSPLEGKITVDPMDFDKLKSAAPAVRAALPKDFDVSGMLRLKDAQIKGTLNKLALKGNFEGTDATVTFGKILRKTSGIPLTFFTDAEYAGNSVSFREAKVKLNNLEIAGKGDVKLGDVPVLNLALDSNRVSLAGWDTIVPMIQDYQISGNLEAHTTVQGKMGKGAAPQIQGTLALSGVTAKPPQFGKSVKDLDAKIDFTGQRADLKDTTFTLGNSRIRVAARIDRFSPLSLSYRLSTPEIWPADFQASIPDDRKSDVIKNLNSEGTLAWKSGSVAFQGKLSSSQGTLYKINYKDLSSGLALEDSVANIRTFRVNAMNGSLQAEGEYAFNNPVPRFSLASKVQGLDLRELQRSLDPTGQRDIQGRLNADMKVSGSGRQWEQIKPSLRGQGTAEVMQGALLNFNIANEVLSGITGVPGLASLINPQVRKKYPETFEAKDTEFKELKGLFTLADARMNVKDLRIAAADYIVQGNGWIDFHRRVDFQSLLILSQRLSADLAHSVREIAYGFNNQNQFELPFSSSGTLPNVRPKPDTNYLSKMFQRGLVRRGAEELERRIFGGKRSGPPAQSAPESAPAEQKSEKKSSTEELIRKGLEGLFRR